MDVHAASAAAAAAAAREQREAVARGLAARPAEDTATAALIRRDAVAGFTELITVLARRHKIRINWRAEMPRGAHLRNEAVREWWHCLECERQAWSQALRLFPFSRRMFQRLQNSLRGYRRTTPAPPQAIDAADQLASNLTWARDRQARVATALRRERQALVWKSLGRTT